MPISSSISDKSRESSDLDSAGTSLAPTKGGNGPTLAGRTATVARGGRPTDLTDRYQDFILWYE